MHDGILVDVEFRGEGLLKVQQHGLQLTEAPVPGLGHGFHALVPVPGRDPTQVVGTEDAADTVSGTRALV